MDKREKTQIMRWEKDNLLIFILKKCLRQLLFLEFVKNKLFRYKVVVGGRSN